MQDIQELKLQVGDIISVHGYVMMKKLDDGVKYRVSKIADHFGRKVYVFTRARGSAVVARHFCHTVDAWLRPSGHEDLNKIVLEVPDVVKAAKKKLIK